MPRSVLALLTLAAALLLAAPAQAVDPLVLASASPADRAVVPPTPTGGIPWQITAPGVPPDAMVSVTVSPAPTTGPDGVLDPTDRDDFFFMTASPAGPGVYIGRSDPGPNAWSAVAATYYWQVLATWTDAGGVFHSAASPILRIVIGTPPPPGAAAPPPGSGAQAPRTTLAMSALDATFYVRAVIRAHTGRRPVKLHYSCGRLSSLSFRCRPSWHDSRNIYSATATFSHARVGGRIVAKATVSGRRASRQCARSRSVKSCARAFHWRAVTAARLLGTS